jgi:hypothetical protein
MTVLSSSAILDKTRAATLDEVRNLNLWGQELTDVSIVRQLANVEVLSLSVNGLTRLSPFACCAKLSELYLRKNAVVRLNEVLHLTKLNNLRILWLCDNPCAAEVGYRLLVIKHLPQITKLDNTDITEDERLEASRLPYQLPPLSRQKEEQVAEDIGQLELNEELCSENFKPKSERVSIPTSTANAKAAVAISPLEPATPTSVSPLPVAASPRVLFPPVGVQASVSPSPPRAEIVHTTAASTAATGTNNNILYAVLCLLGELDDAGVALVSAECDVRLKGKGH